MEEGSDSAASSKPLAFTIDFGNSKNVDTQRQRVLAEKFQKRHKRGQSLSKLEESTITFPQKQHPLTGNLPRKASFQSEGYFSSDEKTDRNKSVKSGSAKRNDLTLSLKNVASDKMTQSFPSVNLPSLTSPEELELKDVSSPELDLVSPCSPKEEKNIDVEKTISNSNCDKLYISNNMENEVFVDGGEFDFDKSDTASDTGTYTLDADNYSEEQKARMSIDRDFKIEQISVQKKTEDYIKSLSAVRQHVMQGTRPNMKKADVAKGIQGLTLSEINNCLKSPKSPNRQKMEKFCSTPTNTKKVLSPIMSPTQNMSIVQDIEEKQLNNSDSKDDSEHNNTFTKIMFPSPVAKREGLEQNIDQGSIISVTSSGAFKPKFENKLERKLSLTKSEVQVQAYIDAKSYKDEEIMPIQQKELKRNVPKLTANIVSVQSIEVKKTVDMEGIVCANLLLSKYSNSSPKCTSPVTTLPPAVGGKTSPSKIPSPIHTLSRPRSRNSLSSLTVEYENSLDTDLILKPTQNYINSLQQRLSMDSDPDSDYDIRYGLQLNNTAHLLKQKTSHTRHNSLDDRTMNISNKLEHFQNKNLQGIDQTFTNLLNQYSQNKVIHKIQNSPNNSPIKRSSSFSTKNHMGSPKNTNIQKETNVYNSPAPQRRTSIQRSSSTACIKPNYTSNRVGIIDHQKIDRNQFGDTDTSSEEDYDKNLQKRKDLSNISNTRCNRAFSLRRARVDNEQTLMRCPNTPEMRRKNFQPEVKQERAISVDRKPMKTNEVQSRYLLNINKRPTPPPQPKLDMPTKNSLKGGTTLPSKTSTRPQSLARTDSGRFSMRTNKPISTTTTSGPNSKGTKKDGKKSSTANTGGPRSNSSLSSREVEFQNWKRRKSYDPMKAAAEGKKKEAAARRAAQQGGPGGTGAPGDSHSQDSSPSRSGSVHRSQSFHGTAALEQLISSEEEEDITLSADEGFSPPTPSPCELSPARASLRHTLWERIRH